jgi:UDPglucose 6-dehydrogenase
VSVSRPPIVGFCGLTHLGLVSAAATAAKGFRTIGFDGDADRVAAVAAGRLGIVEPGLDDLVREHRQSLDFSSDAASLHACDVVFIASDVPTDDAGVSDLDAITHLIGRVVPALDERATLVILCQVPPGFTRAIALPPHRLYGQVETLVLGSAVERASRPERFIVGCADPDAPLPEAYRNLLASFDCPILSVRYESAELAKIAINCALTATLTVANTLAELSERVGADWAEIAPALRLDRRIGSHAYLSPGLGLGGGNLERDLATVLRLATATDCEASVIAAFLRNSAHRRDWVLRVLKAELLTRKADAVVGVLGLAYKAHTDSVKNSPALALIARLGSSRLRVFDPVVPPTAAEHPGIIGAASALEAAHGSDALVVMTPWPLFRELKAADLGAVMAGRTVVDPHRVLDGRAIVAAGLDYFTLGVPPVRSAAR